MASAIGSSPPRGSVALDDDRGWAPYTDEKHGHSVQLSCTSAKDAQPVTVVAMVPDIDGNADARAAERPNRRVHRAERGHHKRLKVRALATRPKAHAGQKPRRRGGLHPVDAQNAKTLAALREVPWDEVWRHATGARAIMLQHWLALRVRSDAADQWVRKASPRRPAGTDGKVLSLPAKV